MKPQTLLLKSICMLSIFLASCTKNEPTDPESTTPTFDPCEGSNYSASIESPDMKNTSIKGKMTAQGWNAQPGAITLSGSDCSEDALILGGISIKYIMRESLDKGVRTFVFTEISAISYTNCRNYNIVCGEINSLYSDKTSEKTSILTITKYDPTNRLISGTFNFDALGSNYNKVRSVFRNGVFTNVPLE